MFSFGKLGADVAAEIRISETRLDKDVIASGAVCAVIKKYQNTDFANLEVSDVEHLKFAKDWAESPEKLAEESD